MMFPDLHPDDLLDREARGALSAVEREALDEHLASCAACRFERCVRRDFADEERALAALDRDGQLDRLIADALGDSENDAEPRKPAIPRASGIATPRGLRPRLWTIAASAALAATVAGFATAGGWRGPIHHALPWLVVDAPVTSVTESVPAADPPPRTTTSFADDVRPAVFATELPRAVREPALAVTTGVAAPLAAPAPARLAMPSDAPPVPEAEAEVALPLPPAPPDDDAPALFAKATGARAGGDHATAAQTYRALVKSYPGAAEARLSHATLGRMLLDDGDAKGALAELDAYLASGDVALREEAMDARATAFRRIGAARDEAGALTSLLEAYPQSVHGVRARARLKELAER